MLDITIDNYQHIDSNNTEAEEMTTKRDTMNHEQDQSVTPVFHGWLTSIGTPTDVTEGEALAVEMATGMSFDHELRVLPTGAFSNIRHCRPQWAACETIGDMVDVYLAYRVANRQKQKNEMVMHLYSME